jgi:hypothetical protein
MDTFFEKKGMEKRPAKKGNSPPPKRITSQKVWISELTVGFTFTNSSLSKF